MKSVALIPSLLLLFSLKLIDTKMILKKVQRCEEKDYPISFNVTTYFENERQFMDSNSTFKVPLSNELKGRLLVELVLANKHIPVISITERNACNCLHKYVGEFAYDIERTIGLTPRLCPIPKGKYRVTHLLLELDKITIRGFPLGLLRFTLAAIDKNNEFVTCLQGEVDNI